jgi:hypothetical protein
VKNTFINVSEDVTCVPLFRHKTSPALLFGPDKEYIFDQLSDSTGCCTDCPGSPLSSSNSISTDAEQNSVKERRDKMAKYCKTKADCHKTTVMIRNVPCKLSQEELMAEVAAVNPNFNLLYLPSSRKAIGNLGYAFVNFVSNEETMQFIEAFQDHVFLSAPRSKKRAEVAFATLQGFKENVRFFKRSRVGKSQNGPYIVPQKKEVDLCY